MLPKTVGLFALISWLSTSCGATTTCNGSMIDSFTPSTKQYILDQIDPLNQILGQNGPLFDGPQSISGANIPTPATTTSLTLTQLMYYNYFAASMYCAYSVQNLSCCYCSHFSGTVSQYAFFQNNTYDTLALVTLHPSLSEIVVSFRGSVGVVNWILDADLLTVDSSNNVKVHQGEYLLLSSIYNPVVVQVMNYLAICPSCRIAVTGHSLGGAMASLFTYFTTKVNQFGSTSMILSTYGQPRSGNDAYANYMNTLGIPMARTVARADLFVHAIPVSGFGLTATVAGTYYLHHGQEIWINGNVTNFCSKTVYEDFSCSDSLDPTYTPVDHLQYFDCDMSTCYFVESGGDVNFASNPITGSPTGIVPQPPSKIELLFDLLESGGFSWVLPLLG